MKTRRTVRVVSGDAGQLGEILMSSGDDGALQQGVVQYVAQTYDDVDLELTLLDLNDFGAFRHELESGVSEVLRSQPDLVVLSVAGEIDRFEQGGMTPDESVARIYEDLTEIVQRLKSKSIRVLLANVSTLDPENPVFTCQGLSEEPFAVRAQRLNLMVTTASRQLGLSVIDVDRVIAEAGGQNTVDGPMSHNMRGCALIRDEIVRIIDDYGFFDDRPLMEQIGAGRD